MAQQIIDPQNSIVPVPRMQPVRLACRRLVAWSLEVGLVAMSGLVPWGVGQYVLINQGTVVSSIEKEMAETSVGVRGAEGPVPLTPLVRQTQKSWARVAQIPPHQLHQTVPRLTNIFWTIALITPGLVAGAQLWQLTRTGKTWSKRWLGIRVISTAGGTLQFYQVLGRELVRWSTSLALVGGLAILTGTALGPWTPVVIGLFAMAEGLTALVPGRKSWHDRIARTQVVIAMPEPLPILRGRYSLSLEATRPTSQLYGETASDDWWLTTAEGNLTSLVLPPQGTAPGRSVGGRLPMLRWIGGMVLACVVGIGIGRITLSPVNGQLEDDTFWQTTQTLSSNIQAGGDYRAAILMLAQVDDPRTAQYLSDLLSQASQPETLAAIQQALVSQGLDSLSPLLVLSHVLESELQQPLAAEEQQRLRAQRHVVQNAIAKLLTIHSNELADIRLDRVNLSHSRDQDYPFRLIQPGLLAAGTSWRGASLNQANLAGASFFDVGADGIPDSYDDRISDLSGIALVGASLENANLQGARLTAANLRGADLGNANLAYSNLEGAQLTGANLINVSAAQSRWRESNLVGADLTQAMFDGADFTQARLNRIEASHSHWQQAKLSGSDWMGANLIGADFSQANLTRADFQGANLDSANFNRADLRQANLRDTDLRQTNLTGVNLADADLAGAIFYDGTNVAGSFIVPSDQLSAENHLRGVNFSRARNLDGRQLNYICAQGGIHPNCAAGVDKLQQVGW